MVVKIVSALMILKLSECLTHGKYNISISFTLYSQVTGQVGGMMNPTHSNLGRLCTRRGIIC